MTAARILTASRILTMDESTPIATAVAVGADGRIAAVGDLAACQTAVPDAEVVDLGSDVLLPGFVESHSHPVLSGITTQPPAYWIAPYVGYPTWSSVTELFTKVHAELPEGQPAMFNGFDRLLHGVDAPTATVLDKFFPGRVVVVADNSGHAVYFNSATISFLGWDAEPPADPVGGSFGRNPDGTSNGQAFEVPAMMAVANKVMAQAVPHPLASAAQWYALMARNGITSTSEMTYDSTQSDTPRGTDQCVTIDQALRAQTIDAAFILRRDHEVGSIEVGKFADFVQLNVDPHDVDPMQIRTAVSVVATWLSGEKLDVVAFEAAAGVADPEPHRHLATKHRTCC